MPELWYTSKYGFPARTNVRTRNITKGCGDAVGLGARNITTAGVARLTLNVVLRRDETELCLAL
jgi:hypothetical protein